MEEWAGLGTTYCLPALGLGASPEDWGEHSRPLRAPSCQGPSQGKPPPWTRPHLYTGLTSGHWVWRKERRIQPPD